ncbi:hypothetical protein JM93_00295 [Roseibium hamelinense]|uniref:Uncharacterized protein n=1 Tax=Roseibium hamelinense TaxID=150831 RepID=A0A562TGM4_9HYPH|nr:hypothetical protein [Roseibium hamelinense]MTI46058.1 hypothetical protein [Roseibium hamelinense]TWI92749.1 hypothetical protein JM93_00295 [Roseibium hamelinense]
MATLKLNGPLNGNPSAAQTSTSTTHQSFEASTTTRSCPSAPKKLNPFARTPRVNIDQIAQFLPPKDTVRFALTNSDIASSIGRNTVLTGMSRSEAARLIQQRGGIAKLSALEKQTVMNIRSNSLRAYIASLRTTPPEVLLEIAHLPRLNDKVLNALANNERSTDEILHKVTGHKRSSKETVSAAIWQVMLNNMKTD